MSSSCEIQESFEQVDVTKRYDIYCRESYEAKVVVYRNAIFKTMKRLLSTRKFDVLSDFMEIEQSNGQPVFIARTSIIKFCEHGIVIDAQEVK